MIKLERLADAKAVLDQAREKGANGDGFHQLEKKLNVPDQVQLKTGNPTREAHRDEPNILKTLKLDQAIKLATKKSKEGAPEEAKRIYQDVLAKFPKNKRATDGLKGLAGRPVEKVPTVQDTPHDQAQSLVNLYSQGQLQQALEQANVLLQQFPNSSFLYNISGAAYKGLGQLDASIEAYRKALAIKPDYADVYKNMGNTLKEQGKLDEAIEAYNKVLAIKPDYADAHHNMGVTFQAQGELEEAIEAYNKVLAIKPDYAEAYNNMGNALKEQGKLEKALDAYKQSLAIKPDNAEAYNNMGNTLKDQGKAEEAIEAYNKTLSLNPNADEAITNLAILLFQGRSFDEAAELFSKDNSSKSQSYLLKCLYELGDRSKFYDKLDYLIERGENNCVIGSFTSRAENRYGIKKHNPFCNDPFKYVLKADLTKEYNFEKIFVENATHILSNDAVKHKSQGHLTNGIQTAGNIFTQVGSVTNIWQDIIHSELKKYKDHFCKSEEGLIIGWPATYSIYGWLVSMKSGGELSAHIHDTGWITGSIYINVPPKLKKDSGNLVITTDDTKPEKDKNKNKNKNSQSIDVVTGSLFFFHRRYFITLYHLKQTKIGLYLPLMLSQNNQRSDELY